MSEIEATECPDKITLTDYLLGQLEAPRLDACESHIAGCDKCHETLRGLSAEDTLTQQVGDAFLHDAGSDSLTDDLNESHHVRGLVDQLLSETKKHPRQPKPAFADTEILADRAAEILRCVESDSTDQALGSIGNYRLIRLLGAGSTGVVFQAIDEKLNRTVALKVLRPSLGSVARERFIAEAQLAASIEHPNVVTIYQIDQQNRLAYIAMQWLPGQTLESKLNATTTIPDDEVRRIACQVAAGLQAAHQRQLVHRDIKPANIWISNEDEVKILDFGLARVVDDDPGLTATGMLAGTPNFMSPEQTKGHELDGRSDLFSLGCMMYRMATGKFAFGATSILGTLQAIQHEQPNPPKLVNAEISSDLSDLTMGLLEKQPANRPESAAQVVTMLEAERDQWPMRIAGYESAQPENKTVARPRPSWLGFAGRWGTVIAASLLALAGWYFSPQIIRIATDHGELVIESEDKDVEVQILKDGKVFRVLDTKTKNSFDIESGDYRIKATREGNTFEVTPESLTMKRGEKTVVVVTEHQGNRKLAKPEGVPKDALAAQEEPLSMLMEGRPADTPVLRKYQVATDLKLAYKTLDMVFRGRDVRMSPDDKTGVILVLGKKDDHQLVFETLATLSSPPEHDLASDLLSNSLPGISPDDPVLGPKGALEVLSGVDQTSKVQSELKGQPTYKGKPFAHWINVTKTDRSTDLLCDALQAGAALAVTPDEKAALLEVTRTLARKYGTARLVYKLDAKQGRRVLNSLDSDNELVQYYEAMGKVIELLAPAEIIQFVLDELEHGTPQSIGFCSHLFPRSKPSPIAWEEARNNAFIEQAPELLKLVVAQIDAGDSKAENRGAVLNNIISTLIAMNSFAGGGKPAYVAGVHQRRVAWAMEKNPTLAPTIRQLFLGSSASTKIQLVALARAFWPNDEEVELALQSSMLGPSVSIEDRDASYLHIVGKNNNQRETYSDFLFTSPKPIAVEALKKLLGNQLGPDDQRIAVMDSCLENFDRRRQFSRGPSGRRSRPKVVEGRPATIRHIVESLETLLEKHHNDTDEDVEPAIHELLQRIVAIEESDRSTLKKELGDFRRLKIFEKVKQLLGPGVKPILEFLIVAENGRSDKDILAAAKTQAKKQTTPLSGTLKNETGKTIGRWINLALQQDPEKKVDQRLVKFVPSKDCILRDGSTGKLVNSQTLTPFMKPTGFKAWLDKQGIKSVQILCEQPPKNQLVTNANLEFADIVQDESGEPSISFRMTTEGGTLMSRLTGRNIKRALAIVIKNEVHSAPTIQSGISTRGTITGDFTDEEAKDILTLLKH